MLTETKEHDNVTYVAKIGKNAQENWDLISDSSQNDIWFHLDNFSSPHVVLTVPSEIKKIPKQLITWCAVLCKIHSKYNAIKKVPVIYTEIKHVKKADKVGAVTTEKTKRIVI